MSSFLSKPEFSAGFAKEDEILEILKASGWVGARKTGKCGYDIYAALERGLHVFFERVEVKNEDKQEMRNLCIETHQFDRKVPSGILCSESSVYIHTFKETSVVYRTTHMREFISNREPIAFGKSDNRNLGVLVRIESIKNMPWCVISATKDIGEAILATRLEAVAN